MKLHNRLPSTSPAPWWSHQRPCREWNLEQTPQSARFLEERGQRTPAPQSLHPGTTPLGDSLRTALHLHVLRGEYQAHSVSPTTRVRRRLAGPVAGRRDFSCRLLGTALLLSRAGELQLWRQDKSYFGKKPSCCQGF